MNAFDVLGDPVRRRILELLTTGELTAGQVVETVQAEFGISQAAVSQHLRVLRDSGFAESRPDGPRRIYRIQPTRFAEVDAWLGQFRRFWHRSLNQLGAEIEWGKHSIEPADSPKEKD